MAKNPKAEIVTAHNARELLMAASERQYRLFSQRTIRTAYPVLGVRVPYVRGLAKSLDESYLDFTPEYYEETLLYGLAAARLSPQIELLKERLMKFLSYADNWGAVDITVCDCKAFKREPEAGFTLAAELLSDGREFYSRFGAVAMLSYFKSGEYFERTLKAYESAPRGKYYIDMAVAWGLSVLALTDFDRLTDRIKSGVFGRFVTAKAISKCLDSYRITSEQKSELRALRAHMREIFRER